MPGGKDIQNKTIDELKKQADEEYSRQETVFDKIWYSLNMTAFYKQIVETEVHSAEVDEFDLEEEFGDLSQVENPSEIFKQRRPEEYFFGDEPKRIKVPHDRETSHKTYEVDQHVKDKLFEDVLKPKNVEDLKKSYQMMGMMMAKIALETEKEYEEKLKKIDLLSPNDPHREDKATYLQMNDTQSKAMSLDNALKNMIGGLSLKEGGMSQKMFAESPVGTADRLKTMTMKEYFAHCWMTEEDQRKYYEEKQNR